MSSFNISVFSSTNLLNWEELRTLLQSAEGGNFRVVEPRDSEYALVRYVKGKSDTSNPMTRWARSVVFHKASRLPVCIAPPKANSNLTEEVLNTCVSAEEFVDGTMINVFRVKGGDATIATRSRIGGASRFYEDGPTFEAMLREAMLAHNVTCLDNLLPEQPEAAAVFTSLVLQHPANRIVQNVSTPTFVIVHQGWVDSAGVVNITENAADFRVVVAGDGDDSFCEVNSYSLNAIRASRTVDQWVTQQAQTKGFGWQGLVLKDGRGSRWRVRSQVYETVRRIRGNESSTEERFARLRLARQTEQYISFYPEDRPVFYELEGRLRANTRRLATYYADVFRMRKVAYNDLPWPYKHHVSVLHNRFKDVLRAEGKKVDLQEVVRYVNALGVEDLHNMCKEHTLIVKKRANGDATTASAVAVAEAVDA
jgi:hypothetical protein